MWVIDIRHWLNDNYDGPAVPRLKNKVAKMKEIIIYATSELAGRMQAQLQDVGGNLEANNVKEF